MSINLPPALAWVSNLAVGQQWPQGDEDKLLALGRAWEEAAQELVAISSQLGPSVNNVLETMVGPVTEAFRQYVEQVGADALQMAASANQLAELATTTGVEIEYAKYMILVQLVWMAVEIAQWGLFAPEAIPAIVTAGRVAVQMILRRLLTSIAAGVGLMVGMDAAIQALQMMKGDRTRWNVHNTLQAVESGAVGGAVGGLTFGIPGVLKPKFAGSLLGKLTLGAVTGVVTTEAMDGIFGGEAGIASAFTSGALGSISGEGRRLRRFGGSAGEIDPVRLRLPDMPALPVPNLETPSRRPELDRPGNGQRITESDGPTDAGSRVHGTHPTDETRDTGTTGVPLSLTEAPGPAAAAPRTGAAQGGPDDIGGGDRAAEPQGEQSARLPAQPPVPRQRTRTPAVLPTENPAGNRPITRRVNQPQILAGFETPLARPGDTTAPTGDTTLRQHETPAPVTRQAGTGDHVAAPTTRPDQTAATGPTPTNTEAPGPEEQVLHLASVSELTASGEEQPPFHRRAADLAPPSQASTRTAEPARPGERPSAHEPQSMPTQLLVGPFRTGSDTRTAPPAVHQAPSPDRTQAQNAQPATDASELTEPAAAPGGVPDGRPAEQATGRRFPSEPAQVAPPMDRVPHDAIGGHSAQAPDTVRTEQLIAEVQAQVPATLGADARQRPTSHGYSGDQLLRATGMPEPSSLRPPTEHPAAQERNLDGQDTASGGPGSSGDLPDATERGGSTPAADLTRRDITFPGGSQRLVGQQLRAIDMLAAQVARQSLANWEADRPLPTITINGHGNGTVLGQPHFGRAIRSGQVRADTVAAAFTDRLDAHLRAAQTDQPTPLRAERFRITAQSRGREFPSGTSPDQGPAARRRAVITIDYPGHARTQPAPHDGTTTRPAPHDGTTTRPGRVTLAALFAQMDDSPSLEHSREPDASKPTDAATLPDRAPAPEAPGETPSQAPAGAERPWYLDRDALGEVSVVRVGDMHAGLAAEWANRIGGEVTRPGDSQRLNAEIREGIRGLLMSGAEPGAEHADQAGHTAHAERIAAFWEKALQQGHLTVASDHVVWLRPVLREMTPTPTEPKPDVVEYKVAYAKLTSSVNSELAKSSGIASTLQTLLATSSAAASVVAPVLPVLHTDAARSSGNELERGMTAGRKVFATEHTRFTGGVHVRVFVDGVERPHDVVTPRQVTVDLPAKFSAPDGPRPDEASPSNSREVTGQQPHHARDVVNAIDLIPMTAALQRHLLEAGLPAHGVREVMSDVLPRLNERSALNRSRYWLTSGVVSDRTRFPIGPGRSFEGHVFLRARIERLQYLGDTPEVAVREDTSGDTMTGHTQGVRSRASAGLAFFSVGAQRNMTFTPTASLTGQVRRDTRHGLSEGAETHTVLTAKSDQARYRAQLRVTALVKSTTHPRIPAFSHPVESEIGVPARESADFERRLLGDDTPPLRQAPVHLDGPVEAQPHIRILLREAGLALPGLAYERPPRLDQPLPPPHPREPLALATRRGQGFAALLALPGAELVHDQIRGSLERWHNRLSGNARADWSGAEHDLLTWFGRPALEIDLPQLLSGVDHTVRLGGRSYDVSVRAHLRDRIGGVTDDDAYPMKVNVRSQQTAKVSGRRDTRWNLQASMSAAVGVKMRSWLRAQIGGVGGSAGFGREVQHTLSGAARSYRRTQAAGPVDEHVYDVVYEISVRSPGRPAERWWIDKPGDVVARVVVPHQHVPATPLSAPELAEAGTVSWPTGLPDGRPADFQGGATGVFPTFLRVPELVETAARMYQDANKLPTEWLSDRANWPAALKAATDTVHLSAEFGALTGRTGKVVELPVGKDGWKQALRVRVTAHGSRHVAAHTGRTVEVQQYSQAQTYAKRIASSTAGIGLQAAAGPQFRIGPGQGNGTAAWNPMGMGGTEGAHTVHAQISAIGSGAVQWEWKRGTTDEEGPVGNSRAAYRDRVHTYRADPVFEVTLYRWKGSGLTSPNSGMTHSTAYLRVRDGMDFLVTERRIFDLGLPAPEGVEQVQPHEPVGYVDPAMLPAVSHAEVLHADGVLDRMKQWLASQGVLRTGGGDSGEHRPDLLLRELERSFSSEALLSQFSLLSSSGVTRWLPLPWAFGATRYLWTNVTAETGPPVSQLSRPEVRLMVRGQTHHETAQHEAAYRTAALSAQLRTRIGTSVHGGLELGAGYTHETGKGSEQVQRGNDIHRAMTEEESQEFEHPQAFRIRMGITSEMPEILSAPARGIRAAALGMASRLGHGRDVADWWYRNQPFVKRFPTPEHPEDGTVHGVVRLIVPDHLVIPGTPPPAPASASAAGTTAVWEPQTPGQDAHRSPAFHQLLEDGHPWALPAAAAAHRWAALTAAPFPPPRDLTAPDAWHIPGLDFTTLVGLRYTHFTSENLLRANLGRLLRHQYKVPVGERTATVGLEVTDARPLTQDAITFSARHHKLAEEASKTTFEQTRGWYAEAGPEGGMEFSHGLSNLEQAPFTFESEHTRERTGETAEVQEPDLERSRPYRHYKADVDLVISGPHGRLRVHVPDGLYFMLPTDLSDS